MRVWRESDSIILLLTERLHPSKALHGLHVTKPTHLPIQSEGKHAHIRICIYATGEGTGGRGKRIKIETHKAKIAARSSSASTSEHGLNLVHAWSGTAGSLMMDWITGSSPATMPGGFERCITRELNLD